MIYSDIFHLVFMEDEMHLVVYNPTLWWVWERSKTYQVKKHALLRRSATDSEIPLVETPSVANRINWLQRSKVNGSRRTSFWYHSGCGIGSFGSMLHVSSWLNKSKNNWLILLPPFPCKLRRYPLDIFGSLWSFNVAMEQSPSFS